MAVRHEQLWAPWRLGYIQGTDASPPPDPKSLAWLPGADPECFLCRGVAANIGATSQATSDSKAASEGKTAADGKNSAGSNPVDRQNLIVGRTERSLVMLNRYPYNNGHLLIAPVSHKGRLDELEDAEHLDCQRTLSRCIGLLERELRAEAFNIGLNLGRTAGAGLPGHLHWHIVPRWNGDTNFMATMAGVRVIPQALDALWETLDAAWRAAGP
jgi:ATP adenylyltransferase